MANFRYFWRRALRDPVPSPQHRRGMGRGGAATPTVAPPRRLHEAAVPSRRAASALPPQEHDLGLTGDVQSGPWAIPRAALLQVQRPSIDPEPKSLMLELSHHGSSPCAVILAVNPPPTFERAMVRTPSVSPLDTVLRSGDCGCGFIDWTPQSLVDEMHAKAVRSRPEVRALP